MEAQEADLDEIVGGFSSSTWQQSLLAKHGLLASTTGLCLKTLVLDRRLPKKRSVLGC